VISGLFPRVDFIVTNLRGKSANVVTFYNKRESLANGRKGPATPRKERSYWESRVKYESTIYSLPE
jgi:hypothetical protein